MTQQTPGRTDEQGRVPRPPVQRISDKRVQMIKALAGAGAIALTAFDAKVSYDGFRMLALPQFVPMVLALLILSIQLASGSVQQLGMNPFQGVGGSVAVDFVWRWVLVGVYVLDIGSNAIAFGVGQHLNMASIQADPIAAFTMPLVLLLLSALLTFGDEILLRLVDRLDIGSRANKMAALKGSIDQRAYAKYLQGYQQRALDHADKAGSRATVDFDWLNGKQP